MSERCSMWRLPDRGQLLSGNLVIYPGEFLVGNPTQGRRVPLFPPAKATARAQASLAADR